MKSPFPPAATVFLRRDGRSPAGGSELAASCAVPKTACIVTAALLVITSAVCGSNASAQTTNRFAVGASISTKQAPDDSSVADHGFSVGFQWRIGHSKEGWGWQYGLHWYSMDIDRLIGTSPTGLGTLRVRPFMGGYGYTHLFHGGRIAMTGDVVAGYAVNSFRLDPVAHSAYQTRLGARSISAEAVNALVVTPEFKIWYDVSKKVGLVVNGGYVFARPDVKVTSTLGTDVHRVHADTYTLKVGLVYSIF
jgi:hypothetical protein